MTQRGKGRSERCGQNLGHTRHGTGTNVEVWNRVISALVDSGRERAYKQP